MRARALAIWGALSLAMTSVATPRATGWLSDAKVMNWAGAPTTPGRREAITFERKFRAPIEFDDLVVSWSAQARDGAWIEILVQALYADRETKWYRIAEWSERDEHRTSINGQKDADGDVSTDTWLLSQPTRDFRVRVVSHVGEGDGFARIDRLDFSFVNSKVQRPTTKVNKKPWGSQLSVPKRCQGQYANGGVLCSPTSTSMIITYWAQQLNRPEMLRDVPEVQSGVFDPGWSGTGNWVFNTGYAAAMGLRAYVSRLNHLNDLETWIAAGFPVATSVSYDLLKGKGQRGPNDGHLVVLIGFTPEGDPIFNDPGRSDQEHHTYKRADFDAAWASSGRAVYLIYPEGRKVPRSRYAPWGQ